MNNHLNFVNQEAFNLERRKCQQNSCPKPIAKNSTLEVKLQNKDCSVSFSFCDCTLSSICFLYNSKPIN
ncbi:MAG: hypothetical protein J6R37_03440 [Clostridia bacterium]|nr:hypothetical protein [Clostridia bacterium]